MQMERYIQDKCALSSKVTINGPCCRERMVWTVKTRKHLRKVRTQCNCEYQFTTVQLHNASILLRVSLTIAWPKTF